MQILDNALVTIVRTPYREITERRLEYRGELDRVFIAKYWRNPDNLIYTFYLPSFQISANFSLKIGKPSSVSTHKWAYLQHWFIKFFSSLNSCDCFCITMHLSLSVFRGVPRGCGGSTHPNLIQKWLVNLYKIDIGRFLKPKRSVNLEFMAVTSYLTICCEVRIFTCIKLY